MEQHQLGLHKITLDFYSQSFWCQSNPGHRVARNDINFQAKVHVSRVTAKPPSQTTFKSASRIFTILSSWVLKILMNPCRMPLLQKISNKKNFNAIYFKPFPLLKNKNKSVHSEQIVKFYFPIEIHGCQRILSRPKAFFRRFRERIWTRHQASYNVAS